MVRGYWFARYIEETRPGLLKELLAGRQEPAILEGRVSAAYDLTPAEFWAQMDERVAGYFQTAINA